MSSYVSSFENQQFHTHWNNIKEKIESADTSGFNIQFQEDFARFVKVYKFIDSLLSNIDPELVPLNIMNNLNNNANNCFSQINAALNGGQLNYLNGANTYIDNILTEIKPYSLYGGKLKRSLRDAIRSYIEEIDKHLENISNTEDEYNKAVEFREKIQSYYEELFEGDEEAEAITEKISSALHKIEKEFEEIDDYYTRLLIDDEEESLSTQIENTKKSIDEDAEEAKELLTETSSKVQELKEFYFKIFGTPNEETGVLEGGLKHELEHRIKELEEYEKEQIKIFNTLIEGKKKEFDLYDKEQREKHDKLFDYINSLIPGATSAGLALAYQERRKKYRNTTIFWNFVFMTLVGGMIYGGYITLEAVDSWEKALKHLLHFSPIYVPAIWFAIYASKRRSESRGFEEEYAHKEALAKSYSSYKIQIEELDEDDKELMEKLLDRTIDTVSENPTSRVLDRKHGDDTPVLEVLKGIKKEIKDVLPEMGTKK